MSETILERTEGRVSYHDSVEEMLERIRKDSMSNVFDRWALQEKIRCKFCLQGLSCQLCSQGPCRISEKGGQDKGVCGIGPDAMAIRNLLLRNIMGAGTYSHHAYEAFRTLRATVEGKTPFRISDVNKLKWMCEKVDININQDISQIAFVQIDFSRCKNHHSYKRKLPNQMFSGSVSCQPVYEGHLRQRIHKDQFVPGCHCP
jgi:carbon-monoxide dehydrogenase catalytic subunit